jgi:hypothetical protein
MIEQGKTYRLYGRMGTMKRMKPVHKDRFVKNLLLADLYTPTSEADCASMKRELAFLAGQGEFEYRPVHG